jgi:hypothetical protein
VELVIDELDIFVDIKLGMVRRFVVIKLELVILHSFIDELDILVDVNLVELRSTI